MIRSVALPVTVVLLLLGSMIGSSDGFQQAGIIMRATRSISASTSNAHPQPQLPSTLFAGTPLRAATLVSMASSSSAETNKHNDNKGSTLLKLQIRKFFLALWRFLMLPMRLFRNIPTSNSSEEATTVDAASLQEPPSTLWESTIATVAPLSAASVPAAKVESNAITTLLPRNMGAIRWATATSDLSGEWVLTASPGDLEYDQYLKQLGQPMRDDTDALGIIGQTEAQFFEQTEEGRVLVIRGNNAQGAGWGRSLVASGVDSKTDSFQRNIITVRDDDDESVVYQTESWWEDGGTSHISWMRGITKYGGGDFECKRYLESGGKVLVCESVFYPQGESSQNKARVAWRFLRKGATL